MKKVVCLILAAVLLLSMAACGGEKAAEFEEGVLYAGFGRATINPTISTPLGGYGASEQRMHERILDDLMATCIAFTDGDETMLLFSVDAIRSYQVWTDEVRARIEEELGVPASNVMIVSTHSHSAPDTTSTHASMTSYAQIYVEGCVQAAKDAMADRAKATMYSGSVETENMTFVRHYTMADGTVAGPNFGDWSSGITGHVGDNDPEMILVKLEREGDKKPILMMNFQAHTTMTGGSDVKDISADYVGVCRTEIEKQADVHFAYFLGACGNQTPNSYINQENNTMPFADQLPAQDRTYITYGTALALYALEALPNLTEVETKAGIQTTSKVVTCSTNKVEDTDKLAAARAVVEVWESQDRSAGNVRARQLGFDSVYEASGIIKALSLPDTRDIEVCASRIGNLYFVNAPYEMFSENALYIKENSPELTMIMTQSNEANGYITDMKAHEYKCYENFSFSFAPGSGELLAENMVDLLKTVG